MLNPETKLEAYYTYVRRFVGWAGASAAARLVPRHHLKGGIDEAAWHERCGVVVEGGPRGTVAGQSRLAMCYILLERRTLLEGPEPPERMDTLHIVLDRGKRSGLLNGCCGDSPYAHCNCIEAVSMYP